MTVARRAKLPQVTLSAMSSVRTYLAVASAADISLLSDNYLNYQVELPTANQIEENCYEAMMQFGSALILAKKQCV